MKTKKCLSAVLALFTLIFVLSGSFSAKAAEYRYKSDYIYDMLATKTEKQFYDQLTASCEKVDSSYDYCYMTDFVAVPRGMSEESAREVLLMFLYDNPRYFWLSAAYHTKLFMSRLYVYFDIIDYFRDGDVRQSAKVKIEKAEQEYIDGALRYDTDYERALYLHNTLVNNVEYRMGDWDQTIASVFLENATVCAGYSKAYELLCSAVGIDSIIVTSETHAWNIIKLDGYWFHVDVTNDYNSDKYFLISDSRLEEIDTKNGASDRHLINKDDYVTYGDSFPKCLYCYTDVATVPIRQELWGDANSDGTVNVRDAAFIAKQLSCGNGAMLPELADYNQDGKINVRDAAALALMLAAA